MLVLITLPVNPDNNFVENIGVDRDLSCCSDKWDC